MKTYRIKLKPNGSFITPLQADTLFGHLCWLIKWQDGEDALKEFLNSFEQDPPFILSDGFPGDLLPAPLHLSTLTRESDEGKRFKEQKKLKKIEWLTLDEFKAVQKGQSLKPPGGERKGFKPTTTLHSSINRITGTTGDEGSLFELEEYVLDKECNYYSVYLKVKDGWEEKVSLLFRDFSIMGYGRKRSVGKGAFEILAFELFGDFDITETASGFVSLSNFVPTKNDPVDGYYKVFVKYGKLGGEFAFSGKPFKRPLMMLKAGSVFKCKEVKPFYGKMVKGLLVEKPEVVQYGYAFAVPIKLGVV